MKNTNIFKNFKRLVDMPAVYAIATDDFGFVKIGYSKSLKQRLRNIQSGCPMKVSIWLAIRTPEPREIEHFLHTQLTHCRSHGEWFKPNECDLDFIQTFFDESPRNSWRPVGLS